jgi:hypothetical protein
VRRFRVWWGSPVAPTDVAPETATNPIPCLPGGPGRAVGACDDGAPVAKRSKPTTPAPTSARPASRPLFSSLDTQVIYCGDNLDQLRKLPDACVDLIYIDPPFNSNRDYETFWGETKERRSFEDRHASNEAYIEFVWPRCEQLARVLKPTGSFYYHCDWHASHHVRIMLDRIFGENNFRSEIIWRRHKAKSLPSKYFPNDHATIFYYGNPENLQME